MKRKQATLDSKDSIIRSLSRALDTYRKKYAEKVNGKGRSDGEAKE